MPFFAEPKVNLSFTAILSKCDLRWATKSAESSEIEDPFSHLEDARPDEDAVAAELHEERDVGGRGQPARRERHHRQPTRPTRLPHDLKRDLKMIHGGQSSFI